MTAPQILLNNFLYDSSQLAIPFDHVDADFLARPKKFDIGFMKKFMLIFGPLSSFFDFITFGVLLFVSACFRCSIPNWLVPGIHRHADACREHHPQPC